MNDSNAVLKKIITAFPFLQDSADEVKDQLLQHVSIATIPMGRVIFFEGDECKQLALILTGAVRIYKPAESGREITLYRLTTGDSCILTASCIFAQKSFPAVAITEKDVEAAIVPSHVFRDWINRYEIWRTYVFNLLSKRLSEVIATLEEVAFNRMDRRIAELLITLSGNDKKDIQIKHQDIAMELGTSREVVSRILKHFEYEHIISLKRGFITVRDFDNLKKKIEQGKF